MDGSDDRRTVGTMHAAHEFLEMFAANPATVHSGDFELVKLNNRPVQDYRILFRENVRRVKLPRAAFHSRVAA
jgi:hypothetical protein